MATIFESTCFGLLEPAVLEQLLRVDAAAVEIVGCLVPVLLKPAEQILEADGDGTTLIVLHLHRGAVEAEELPHLIGRDRDGPFFELRNELGAGRRQGDDHHRVLRNTAGERARRSNDGRASRNIEPRSTVGAARSRAASARTAAPTE